eukprot:2235129-Rhodomonas_salina.3
MALTKVCGAGAGSGPWLNSRAVPPTIQSQLQDIEKAESRGGRRPKYPTMQNASNEPDMSPAADAARSMVKMQLADVGGGVSAERQAFTTRTRMELARGRRQEARRVAKVRAALDSAFVSSSWALSSLVAELLLGCEVRWPGMRDVPMLRPCHVLGFDAGDRGGRSGHSKDPTGGFGTRKAHPHPPIGC